MDKGMNVAQFIANLRYGGMELDDVIEGACRLRHILSGSDMPAGEWAVYEKAQREVLRVALQAAERAIIRHVTREWQVRTQGENPET